MTSQTPPGSEPSVPGHCHHGPFSDWLEQKRAQPSARSKVDIFRELVYGSNLPLNRKNRLVARYEKREYEAAPPKQQQTPGEFRLFTQLPPEIRTMIWEHLQDAAESRVLNIRDMSRGVAAGSETSPPRVRMPVLASVCREAYSFINARGRRDLRTGLRAIHSGGGHSSRSPAADPVRKCAAAQGHDCGFLMPSDVVHYDETPIGFAETSDVHHPCGIPRALKSRTVSVLFADGVLQELLDYILRLDRDLLDDIVRGKDYWKIWSFLQDWAFLKDNPQLQTLYVGWKRSHVVYERCASLEEFDSTADFALGRGDDNGDELTALVDLYDDDRLAELSSLEVPQPQFEADDPARQIFGGCIPCMREEWETLLRPGMEMLWVMLHIRELSQSQMDEILMPGEGQGLNKKQDWVKEKLQTMPGIRPFVKLSLCSSRVLEDW
jgi:hypothetical protein